MHLDIPTLLVVLFLTTGILATSVLVVAWRDRAHDGLGLWGIGLLLNWISYPLFGLRMLGWMTASVILYNAFNATTLACHTHAVTDFRNDSKRRLPRSAIWAPVVLCVLLALIWSDHHQIRNVSIAAVSFVQSAMLAYSAANPLRTIWRQRGRILVTLGASMLMLMFVVRMVTLSLHPDWSDPLGVPAGMQAMSYLVVLASILLNTMGFVLMQKERAVDIQREQAVRDSLTGVFNRRALIDEMGREMSNAARHAAPLSVLMIDLDHFKNVNDVHGHQAGDVVLRTVAQRIQSRLRRGDVLARFGGEEFLVLLPATGATGAHVIAEAIRCRTAEEPVVAGNRAIPVTLSIGFSACDVVVPGMTADGLIAASDDALYRAKAGGRNCVVGSMEALPVKATASA